MEKTNIKIDFVIPWVDGNDPAWQKERALYMDRTIKKSVSDVRFRDWNNLQYWFRGVEENAPWVNKIHFITYGHFPDWLNRDHPKLNIVNHKDYIPSEYLPTFNSHTIELNLHRITGLSEHFVYFNDDIFIMSPVKERDFFYKNLPCDTFALNCIYFGYDSVGHIHGCNIEIINKYFNKREQQWKCCQKWFHPKNGWRKLGRSLLLLPWPWFPGFYYQHLANSYCKKTFEKVWSLEFDILDETCRDAFRHDTNVNQWIFKFWQLASGSFSPRSTSIGKCIHVKDTNIQGVCNCIENSLYQILCINDTAKTVDFDLKKELVRSSFKKRFPVKSSFEI